ncbi:hypothetical protein FNV43_RR21188 [Rhamnella rubrinervis]|uniref:Uncharacterized protein n=1 Tax=Rhamnella rubrinervis TaxID=2594499 RepID=A0A8K0DXE8_9ROSA|nr:hypothetical protein FNV43_RR21188 [Rhamnella rubrinervis]
MAFDSTPENENDKNKIKLLTKVKRFCTQDHSKFYNEVGELSIKDNENQLATNLSTPLAFQASLGGDFAVPAVHQGLQAMDLVFVVDIDFKVEVVSVASMGPGEVSAMAEGQGALSLRCAYRIWGQVRSAREELGVEDAGEEEGRDNQKESCDVVGAGAEKLVVRTGWSNFVGYACHLGNWTPKGPKGRFYFLMLLQLEGEVSFPFPCAASLQPYASSILCAM